MPYLTNVQAYSSVCVERDGLEIVEKLILGPRRNNSCVHYKELQPICQVFDDIR